MSVRLGVVSSKCKLHSTCCIKDDSSVWTKLFLRLNKLIPLFEQNYSAVRPISHFSLGWKQQLSKSRTKSSRILMQESETLSINSVLGSTSCFFFLLIRSNIIRNTFFRRFKLTQQLYEHLTNWSIFLFYSRALNHLKLLASANVDCRVKHQIAQKAT